MIKIYTTTYCPFCKLAKEFLLEHGFNFEEINVEEDEKALKKCFENQVNMVFQ
jgi:mycoredoxin